MLFLCTFGFFLLIGFKKIEIGYFLKNRNIAKIWDFLP